MGGIQSAEHGRYGFHVLKVKENSPAYHAGIEQFFDYIVAVDGISLEDGDAQILLTSLQQRKGSQIPLTIYSSKERAFREINLIPRSDWSSDPNEKSLIGCSIRYCTYERAGEYVWHILDVAPNSPAEMAGIIPHTDYVIGSPQTVLKSDDDFYNLVEENLGKSLRLYVYNTEWDSCREVIIVPNHDWGGAGSLGCDVGFGLLHRIPRRKLNQHEEENYSSTIFSAADFEPTTDTADPSVTSYEEGPTITPQQRLSIEESVPPVSSTISTTSAVSVLSPLLPEEATPELSSSSALSNTLTNQQQEHLLREAQNTRLPDSPQVDED